MFTIAVIGQKGGTGKTTTTVELAVTAAHVGEAVAIIDVDPQANAANWKDRRADENPAVVSAPPGRLQQTLEAARASGADLAIIDTPGKNDNLAMAAARLADLVLVPSKGTIYDMETLPAVRDLIQATGTGAPAFVLYNEIPPTGTRIADDLKSMTKDYCGLEPCPVHLTRRQAYQTAPSSGKAGQEIETEGKIAAEAERLYLFIREQVNKFRSEHDKGTTGRAAKRA